MAAKARKHPLEHDFGKAVRHYENGNMASAEKLLTKIQRAHPGVPDVLHLLGLIAIRTERAEEAIRHLEAALAAAPDTAELLGLLGGAYRMAGRGTDAADAYGRAAGLAPERADFHFNLANALRALGRGEDAVPPYRRAVELAPDFADAHYNLALALKELGRLDDALVASQAALALAPGDAEALNNLGNILRLQDRLELWFEVFERALAAGPEAAPEPGTDAAAALAAIHNNLGNVLNERDDPVAAIGHFETALALAPDDPETLSNLGAAHRRLGALDAATAALEKALALRPGYADALVNLGSVRADAGDLEGAAALFDQALAEAPDHAQAHVNKSTVLFLAGDLENAWTEAEWRWRKAKGERERSFPQQPWRGEDPRGRTILVSAEQGVGEEVMFASMVPDLVERGAQVVLECEQRLIPLFGRSFAGVRCVAWRRQPVAETLGADIDFQVPSGGLGRWLRPGLDAFPARPSYLAADAAMRDALRKKYLGGDDVRLVGIAWRSANRDIGRMKSMTLADWGPIAAMPGVRLVDLQYGDTAAERRAFEAETGVAVIHDETVDQMADLDAFAAQIAAMDTVVTVSNTTAHMAGALGVPTRVLLNTVPLGWWLIGGDTSPWYPSARLYRQTQAGDWSGVIAAVAGDLGALDKAQTDS